MPTSFQITPVVQTPAHELVADQLQRAIMLGRYLPGDRLPAERTMAEQFGVSRTSVREAIHILVQYGLLEIRRGATGGAFVQNLIDDGIRQRMVTVARQRKKHYTELAEFRLIIESAAAKLAARNRTQSDLRKLQHHVKRMDALFEKAEASGEEQLATRFYAEDTAFHIQIARCSRNPYLLESVEDVRFQMFLPLGRVVAHVEAHANDVHHEIFEAISNGDESGAAQAMHDHISESFSSLIGD